MNLAYYMLTRGLSAEDRVKLDDSLRLRPEEVDPDTGLAPPAWWHGEDDAADQAAAFLGSLRR